MKKLNRKGFTLIELLAVIVIMAIIVVVTVPTIINTIADARVNSIWNLAVATANSYDTIAAQDMIATNKVLTGVEATSTWSCISPGLAEILDLSGTDVVLDDPDIPDDTYFSGGTPSQQTCSAIKLKDNGSADVLLVAKGGGKFSVSNRRVYAFSYDDKGTIKTLTGAPL